VAGILYAWSEGVCTDAEEILPTIRSCYLHRTHTTTENKIFAAMDYFFDYDFGLGTNAMIDAWKSIWNDIRIKCPQKPVRLISESLKLQLRAVQVTPDWFLSLDPPSLYADPELIGYIITFLEGFDVTTTGS